MTETTYPAEVMTQGGVRGRILVIDDEADIRESLEALLTTERFSVECASSGTEGLKKPRNRRLRSGSARPHDARKSGMEVLEELRARDTEHPFS